MSGVQTRNHCYHGKTGRHMCSHASLYHKNADKCDDCFRTRARTLIDDAKQAIFGGDTVHDTCVCVLMIYHGGTHADSAKRETIDTAIDDYLKTPDDQVHKLLAMTKRGKFLNIDDDIKVALKGAWELPGMTRLNYQENGRFTKAWLDLWNAVINILCFQEREKQDIGEVNRALNDFIIDSKDHVDCRQKNPVHEVHTNQKLQFMNLAEVCKRMNMPERLPDKYSRAINFLAAVDDDTFNKLEKILEGADNIQDADMTCEKTVKLGLLAETRLKKRISDVTLARQLRRGPAVPPKKTGTPGSVEDKKKKDEESDTRKTPPKKDGASSGFLKLPNKVKNSRMNNQIQRLTPRQQSTATTVRIVVGSISAFQNTRAASVRTKVDGEESGQKDTLLSK